MHFYSCGMAQTSKASLSEGFRLSLEMNPQQAAPKPSTNGFGRRRGDRDIGARVENKLQSGKSNANKLTSSSALAASKVGGYGSPSRDRLVYVMACLIGQHVEVQMKNGSKYNGIFHATNAEKDFGIILKMARLIKDSSLRAQKTIAESISKAPSKTLIIPGEEVVQVIAKDVSITRDGLLNEVNRKKLQELMLDSTISQSHHGEVERELEPWVPDEDDPQLPELENIFDAPWKRNWDQFETNKTLFGVKSTYDEDIYTTKLERGPKMRELEREASRIAREIEGEETRDLHLAEERGIALHDIFDIDEETRFSSVYRKVVVDDSGHEENEDVLLESNDIHSFGGSSHSLTKTSIDLMSKKSSDGSRDLSNSTSSDRSELSQSSNPVDICRTSSCDSATHLASELPLKCIPTLESESRVQENQHGGNNITKESVEKLMAADDTQLTNSVDLQSECFPSHTSLKGNEKISSPSALLEGPLVGKAPGEVQTVNSCVRPGSCASSTSDGVAAAAVSSRPGLSPSSSVGSLASEKSTLNPHAKEFKLNPNAKSFMPSQTPVRPHSPVSDTAFYYQNNISTVPHMHGMPFGVGIGSAFTGHQPVIINPPVAPIQSPQAYFQPNGPQYGQPMLLGHPRPFMYMPGYQPGREY